MTDDYRLFDDPRDGGPALDADVAIITAYLARELSPVQIAAVEKRMSSDAAFRSAVEPILDAWAADAPAPRERASRVATTNGASLEPAVHDAMWRLHVASVHARRRALRFTRMRSAARLAAVWVLIIGPMIGLAQVARSAFQRREPASAATGPRAIERLPTRGSASTSVDLGGATGVDLGGRTRIAADRSSLSGAGATGTNTAQQPTTFTLAPPNAIRSWDLRNITAVHELNDQRVIILESPNHILVADFVSGAAEAIPGPLDYAASDIVWWSIWSRGANSIRVLDASGRRLLSISDRPRVGILMISASDTMPNARGGDTLGHTFTVLRSRALRDSITILRRGGGERISDTLTRLRSAAPIQVDANGLFSFCMLPIVQCGLASRVPIRSAEEIMIFPDGAVAVIRLDPYRVDWRTVDGMWTLGAPLPFRPIAMDEREKAAFITRVGLMTGQPKQTVAPSAVWPATVPPYESPAALIALPDGRLAIPRLATADAPETRYDIVNRRGTLDGQLVMAANERLVGAGPASVYVAQRPLPMALPLPPGWSTGAAVKPDSASAALSPIYFEWRAANFNKRVRSAASETLRRHPWPPRG